MEVQEVALELVVGLVEVNLFVAADVMAEDVVVVAAVVGERWRESRSRKIKLKRIDTKLSQPNNLPT